MNNLKIERIIKYILMGLVVILATRYIPNYEIPTKELIMIGATSSIAFAILDMVSPAIKVQSRKNSNKQN